MVSARLFAQFVFDNIRLILIAGICVNAAAFIIFFIDKRKAEQNNWRIPEAALLRIGFAAPFGALIGMRIFHHKTRKLKFRLLLPLFLIARLALWAWLIYLVLF